MINDINGKVILSAITLFIHIGVLALYWQEGKFESYPQTWSYPFAVSVILMLCCSSVMPFINRFQIRLGMLMFRLVTATILAVPFSNDMLSFGFIFALLIFEGFLYFPSGLAVITSILCVAYNIWLANLHISLWFQPAAQVSMGSFMVIYALFAICGAAGFYLSREQRLRVKELKLLQELRDSNESLASININLQNVAADERNITLETERNRIAREIHDTVAYTLTNLLSHLDAYRERLMADSREVPENIMQARSLVREGLGDIRKVLRGLRPGENEGYHGLAKINHLLEVFTKATGIKIVLNYGEVSQYPGNELEDVFYRVVQEGLTNAFRHGRATEVLVSFHREGTGIELTVRDNGQGSENNAGGFGLIGIGERVKALDGRVTILSKPGLGFNLRVWLPLQQKGEISDGSATVGYRG